MAGREVNGPILATLENKRLVFESQSDFDITINNLKEIEDEDLKHVFEPFYNQGFIPTYPNYSVTDERRITEFFEKKIQNLPKNLKDTKLDFDDLLISDPLFASLINSGREIIIGDNLIKYTFSGALIAKEKDSVKLKRYFESNDLINKMPDPTNLPTGLTALTSAIDVYVSGKMQANPTCISTTHQTSPFDAYLNCEGSGSPGSYGGSPQPNPDYINSMLEYIKDLEACNYDDAGFMTPFGTRKVCYEKFTGGKRETKSLYSNEDYWAYAAVQVKIKHRQRHRINLFLGEVVWWGPKKTDEVALLIEDAIFKITPPNMTAPPPSNLDMNIADIDAGNMIFYSNGRVVDPNPEPLSLVSWPVTGDLYPSTPFDEDVIVQFFNNNISFDADMAITSDQVSDLFWNSVYSLAVQAGEQVDTGGDVTKITMLISSPTSTIVHYVNLENRKTNTKKIKEVLDEDWGATITLNIALNGNNNVVTDPAVIGGENPSAIDTNISVNLGNLTQFDDLYMDFTGLSRRGSEWRGSKMVYRVDENN